MPYISDSQNVGWEPPAGCEPIFGESQTFFETKKTVQAP